MRQSMQRIVPADEQLIHQLPETFATVSESDVSWTEKLWASLFAKDGSLQIDCGLGKYHNRNVMDGFAGISRGAEQWTVRASRQLDLDPERTGVGPIDYEVVEPLKAVRWRLGDNDVLPLRFDVTCRALLPPFLESPDRQREPFGYRLSSQVLRYHQALSISGWIEVDGDRVEVRDDEWMGYRDHSWGVRMDVGEAAPDVHMPDRLEANFLLTWSPMFFRRPDGSVYEFHHYHQKVDERTTYFSGHFNLPDGTQVPVHGMRDDLRFNPDNRRLLDGTLTLDCGWGETRTIEFEAVSDTGFHLGTANYFGFKGNRHGTWLGQEWQDGERYDDVSRPDVAREVRQLRDNVLRVREGDAEGFAIFESIAVGEHPSFGLTKETSFL